MLGRKAIVNKILLFVAAVLQQMPVSHQVKYSTWHIKRQLIMQHSPTSSEDPY